MSEMQEWKTAWSVLYDVIESFSFKLRMLHDTGMIHSRYIHDAL